ncbi:hypothetical protein ACHQM5_021799 [Ranunculus cassubicifolius]
MNSISYPTTSSTSPPSLYTSVVSPCAACKILRRKCVENCVLAPYFPPSDPLKFTTAHRVFGASNIIKFLQELPECQRADAVSSMVFEANARIRDPVYGCAGAISHLQKEINDLQIQLAMTKAQLVGLQSQYDNLSSICMDIVGSSQQKASEEPYFDSVDFYNMLTNERFSDDNNLCSMWDLPLWA